MDKLELLAAAKAVVHTVHIAALSRDVHFRVMSGKQRDAYYSALNGGDKSGSFYAASLVIATVVDGDGQYLFTQDDMEAVQELDALALDALTEQAMRVNRMGSKAEAEAAKN